MVTRGGDVCVCVLCVCVSMSECMQVCVVHPENTPDALQFTSSSCRDWLWLRLDRHDCRKLMSDSLSCRCTLGRSCAVATLEDTLHQSSVVGYKVQDNTVTPGQFSKQQFAITYRERWHYRDKRLN